jgi:hypothetical protein
MTQQTKQTPKEFFEKNWKWIALIFFVLFLFKSAQGCVRSMNISTNERKTTHTIDSLTKNVDILERKLELCTSEVKIKNEVIGAYRIQMDKKDGKPITIINNIPNQRDTSKRK